MMVNCKNKAIYIMMPTELTYQHVDFRNRMIYFLNHVDDYDQDYTKDIADLLPDNLKAAGIL